MVKASKSVITEPESINPMGLSTRTNQSRVSKKRISGVLFLILVLAVGFLGGWLGSKLQNSGKTTIEQQKVVLSSEGAIISNIAKTVGQSVVSINVTGQASVNSGLSSLFGGGGQTQTQQSAGTGIILTKDGLIITNRHVVPAGTTSVSVTLSDGTTYNNVQVIGRTSADDTLDIAFLKIQNTNGKSLIPAQIGDSSTVQVGDPVVAIGNALGQFQNTVTSGILSGYGRSVQASDSNGTSPENLDDLFQTDAAINEGNSGGPLVNLDGDVIGINTALAQSAENIGFSIPINDVTGLIKSVEATGKLQRPYLGIIYIPITSDVVSQYNLSVNNGAWIPPSSVSGEASILSGGPASKAGLQEGDIITQINGTNINQTTSLTSILDKETVGSSVNLTIIRSGKTIHVSLTVGAAPTG